MMITIEEALGIILDRVEVLAPRRMGLEECLGRVLGEDIFTREDIPPFANSAMDGFAVRAGDTSSASPASPGRLKVLEDLPAGAVTGTVVGEGEAIRIMTGAPLPEGADAVVMVENTREGERGVEVLQPVRPGENVREAGESVRKGEAVLSAGTVLRPPEIGMLAALGYPRPLVIPPPAAAIVSTGDELLPVGEELRPGKIRDCNRYSLAAAVEGCGGVAVPLVPAGDRDGELRERLREALASDLVITSGGISAGKYDLVREVLGELGGELLIRKVSMKPGKPLTFTVVGKTPVFSLPGNPVSVLVSFLQFVRPALLKMQGKKKLGLPEVEATLSEPCFEETDRTHLVRVRVKREGEGWQARPTGPQGSGILKSLVLANGLMVVPPNAGPLPAGARVKVILLED
jgi:molybdopterin molybdotransferase